MAGCTGKVESEDSGSALRKSKAVRGRRSGDRAFLAGPKKLPRDYAGRRSEAVRNSRNTLKNPYSECCTALSCRGRASYRQN
jgi:hypothetical protein